MDICIVRYMYCLISIFRCVHCVYTHMKYFSDNMELHISLLRHCLQLIIFHKVDVPVQETPCSPCGSLTGGLTA